MSLLFQPIFSDTFTIESYIICMATAFVLGIIIALTANYRSSYSKSFILTLVLLPAIVQTVIMLVNGNIGTGVAVMGAFSLIRFRSVPGTAKEIVSIFIAMAVGLATATGYIGIAVLFTIIMCAVTLAVSRINIKDSNEQMRELKITVPESLNYAHAFDDLFDKYTTSCKLTSSKTTNMGSLYRLHYLLCMKDSDQEQSFIDELRCRNGNLEIALGMAADSKERL